MSNIAFCGDRTYAVCLADNSDQQIPNEHWRNLCRQAVAVDLNIRRFDCNEPQPLRVSEAYEEAFAILQDPSLCDANNKQWSSLTRILTDYNEGAYCGRGGPCHCDDVAGMSRRDAARRSDGDGQAGLACVRNISTLIANHTEVPQRVVCGMSASDMLHSSNIFGAAEVGAVAINNKDVWPPRPIDVEESYARVVQALDESACGDIVDGASADVTVLADYLTGEYYDMGGPCQCWDSVCLQEQRAMAPQHGSPVHSDSDSLKQQIAKLSAKNAGYMGTASGFFALGAGVALCSVCTLGVLFVVIKRKVSARSDYSRSITNSDEFSDRATLRGDEPSENL